MLDAQGEDTIRAAFANAQGVTSDKGSAYAYPALAPEALVGIAGEFVRMIAPASESDPAALLLQFIVMAGCALGRTAYYEVEATRHYTNLFAVAVGPTAAGRK